MQPTQLHQDSHPTEQDATESARSNRAEDKGEARSGKPERDLVAWLQAEGNGQEAKSERALLELLSHLPQASTTRINAGRMESCQTGSKEVFSARLIRRIEKESGTGARWMLGRIVAVGAASIVVCWSGILLFAVLLGLDPTATTTAGEALAFCARSIASVPATLAAAVSGAGRLWVDARNATEWMYSPWLLLGGWLSLGLASVALVGLGRLLPDEEAGLQAGYDSASLGVV